MKRYPWIPKACGIVLLVFIVIGVSTAIQQSHESGSFIRGTFHGERALRKMQSRTDASLKTHSQFFIIFGSSNHEMNVSPRVTFSWRMNDGDWAITTVPLESVRVRLDKNQQDPVVTFHIDCDGLHSALEVALEKGQLQDVVNDCVKSVGLRIRDSDWPTEIELPLNKQAQAQ